MQPEVREQQEEMRFARILRLQSAADIPDMAILGDSVRPAGPCARLYLVCGPAGSGKSDIARALTARVADAGVDHRLFDRYGPEQTGSWYGHDAPVRHLETLCAEGVEEGATVLVATWPLRTQAELAELRDAMPWLEIWVCRLRAPEQELLARLEARESSFMLLHLQSLAVEAAAELEASGLGDLVMDTSEVSADGVADAVLRAAPPVLVRA